MSADHDIGTEEQATAEFPLESLIETRNGSLTVDHLIESMTERTRTVLSRMQALSDCSIKTSDGVSFLLPKSKLIEESGLFG